MAHPVAGAAAAGFLLLSVWGAQAPVGLSGLGDGWGSELPRGEARLFGLWLPRAEVPVVLDSARLVDPRGIEAVGAWGIPLEPGASGVGVAEDPPVGVPTWGARVPVEGAVLEPGRVYQVVLALSLVPTADAGASDGVVVAYHSASRSYATTSGDRYELRVS